MRMATATVGGSSQLEDAALIICQASDPRSISCPFLFMILVLFVREQESFSWFVVFRIGYLSFLVFDGDDGNGVLLANIRNCYVMSH